MDSEIEVSEAHRQRHLHSRARTSAARREAASSVLVSVRPILELEPIVVPAELRAPRLVAWLARGQLPQRLSRSVEPSCRNTRMGRLACWRMSVGQTWPPRMLTKLPMWLMTLRK